MSEWKTVRLGDVCEILDSKRVPITAHERKNGSYPYYGANGIQDYVADYIFDDELVLLAEDGGNFGSKEKPIAYRVSGKCWVNNHAHVLKPKECLDVDYLCDSIKFYDVSTIVNGATRQKLTQSAMVEMKIFLPPLETQKQIAAQLDKCTSIITKHKQMLEKYDTLIKSRFIEMFGDIIQNTKNWELKSFTEIAKSRLGKMLDSKKQTGKEKYPYLANFNVQWFRFNLENLNEMDFSEADRIEFALKDGDLLVCEGGEVGRCAVWHNQIENCFFQKAVHRVRLNMDLVHPDYMAYWFKFRSDFNSFDDIVGSKATIAHLTGEKLKLLQIPLPPLSLQNDFAAFVQQIDKSKFAVQKSLEKAETLYKSLMQQYFA